MKTLDIPPLADIQSKPDLFVREVLGVTTNFPKQNDILRSLAKNKRTAVRSGNGVGVTEVAAQAALAMAAVFRNCRVIHTASTQRQIAITCKRIEEKYQHSKIALGGECTVAHVVFPSSGSSIYPLASYRDDLFEGIIAERVVIIMDCAQAIPQEIFDAIDRIEMRAP